MNDADATAAISKVSVFLTVVRRSGPHVLEASLIPTALFYCFLPLATFVAVKQVASVFITGVGMAVTINASVRTARREGIIAQASAGLVTTT